MLIKVKSSNASLSSILVCIRSYLKSVLTYKFLILDTSIRTLHINVSKDVVIRGSSSKPKDFREKKSLEKKTRLDSSFVEEFHYGVFRSVTIPKLKAAVMRIYKEKNFS
jgi:hypothetical protein